MYVCVFVCVGNAAFGRSDVVFDWKTLHRYYALVCIVYVCYPIRSCYILSYPTCMFVFVSVCVLERSVSYIQIGLTDLNAHRMGEGRNISTHTHTHSHTHIWTEFTYERFVEEVVHNCPNLTSLDLSDSVGFSDTQLEELHVMFDVENEDW